MTKRNAFGILLSVHLLAAGFPLLAHAQTNACHIIHGSAARGLPEHKVDWRNDLSYLETQQRKEIFGLVDTYFSKEWDTQVYYTATGLPNRNGRAPLVDPNSKGVFIFFHGSGTMKSGGRNFIGNMNTLANLGFSALSIDLPFHAEGSTDPRFLNADYFMQWARQIVLEAKKAGVPVYLAGHSFGPDVILEIVSRNPRLVDGVAPLSPAGFTKELEYWYDNFTSKMKFGGDVAENEAGGVWAATMSKQFGWSKGKWADPTIVNPKLKMRILSGDHEEYVEAPLGPNMLPIGPNTYDIRIPLKKIFKNATVTIEPGAGHYIFDFTDRNGYNVVLRELLAITPVHISQMKSVIEEVKLENDLLAPNERMAKRYVQDPIFKAWADMTYGTGRVLQLANQQKESLAKKIMDDFFIAQKNREFEIYQKILATKETHPEFYQKYKDFIDKSNPKKTDMTLFAPYLAMVLKNQPAAKPK